ncbi:MAG: glycosyltransferase family 1 protein [Pseudomonadota bacterium]|nr:glycosyltransferase family 1 protein [Pseudomonadota bacterium]
MSESVNPTRIVKRITLVTDAWSPQVNGVVTTLTQLVNQLRSKGIEVDVIHPMEYDHIPLPTYKEIPWVWRAKHLKQRIEDFKPDAIHIATEGGLGWKARRIAIQNSWPFTTAYHTKYPEYIRARLPIPISFSYPLLRLFHSKATRTFAPAPSIRKELANKGFDNLVVMTRGVDTDIFNPTAKMNRVQLSKHELEDRFYLYVGRIATEKNLEAFLNLNLPGQKVVVGKGPDLEKLHKQYPEVLFAGPKFGHELAQFYASAAVFVFPSLTDTFGVVNIEAIACGTPIAAFPVTGPKDILSPNINGVLSNNLQQAILEAEQLSRAGLPDSIKQYTWETAANEFLENLALIEHLKALNSIYINESN